MYRLVIVESPTKARTLSRFLSDDFVIEASVGHVRDLPQSASDIPARYKKLPWASLGINVEEDFDPLYIIPKNKKPTIKMLKEKLSKATELYLATDDDREGESICWHLMEILRPTIPTYRLVFHEITQKAITQSLTHSREINMQLVKAQETRRVLDRLFGYTLSPLIWKKIAYGLSAGRVQSPALRMLVTREWERVDFQQNEYWDIVAQIESDSNFSARLTHVDNKTLAKSKDFDSITGKYKEKNKIIWLRQHEAEALAQKLTTVSWKVLQVEEKPSTQSPPPPFITSSLQQTANRQFGWNARQTMRVAQRLYEMGHITYMRTDAPTLSEEALRGIRKIIQKHYGPDYLSETPRIYRARSSQTQGAHEAIRPAGENFTPIEKIGGPQEKRLYQLIYHRALACQMTNVKKKTRSIRIQADNTIFSASHTVITFPGFLILYQGEKAEDGLLFHNMELGSVLPIGEVQPDGHTTNLPPRYNEASLIHKLEEEGIGRPSTYASIISTLLERRYAIKKDAALVPTFTGIAVTHLMEENFSSFMNYKFTADMEMALDNIANGTYNSLEYLKSFYLGQNGLKILVETQENSIDPQKSRTITHPKLKHSIQISRYGAYIDYGDKIKVNLSEEHAPADITDTLVDEIAENLKKPPEVLGVDPETGKNIYIRSGRYGFYLQLGEVDKDSGEKPRTVQLPMSPHEVTLEITLKLLSLPRMLGPHPETNKPITVAIGRFGPYVKHNEEYRSIKDPDDVYTISLSRAVELLKIPKKPRGKRTTGSSRRTP